MTIVKKKEEGGLTGRGWVTMTITGPKEEVEKAIEEYLKDYHPNGYGSQVVDRGFIEGGDYMIRVKRHSSCD